MTTADNNTYPVLQLKKREERRLRAGHLWVYSNEIDTAKTPLKGLAPGQPVIIQASNERPLAMGYANPQSLIAARVLSRSAKSIFDASLIEQRIRRALVIRESLYAAPYYRLVFGESDALPGLVIDRYNDVFSVQITTAGMEAQKDTILSVLDALFSPKGIVLRNDSSMRLLEGLETYIDVQGAVPDRVEVREQESRFEVSLTEGQKTGWFFDQADNRSRMLRYVAGKRVLDLFSYVGGWGIRAAVAGAARVTCVDVSADAVQQVVANAQMNGVDGKLDTLCGDVFEVLKQLRADEQQFDVIIADPPAFVKRKKDFDKGSEAYQRLNHQAMQLLADDAVLITASCSFHMEAQAFQRAIAKGAYQAKKQLQILERGGQSVDHPVHAAMPETEYLKALYCRVY